MPFGFSDLTRRTCCSSPSPLMRGPDSDRAREVLAEIVQAWPTIVTSAGWDDFVARSGVSTSAIEAAAAEQWIDGEPIPDLPTDQGIWLAVLGVGRRQNRWRSSRADMASASDEPRRHSQAAARRRTSFGKRQRRTFAWRPIGGSMLGMLRSPAAPRSRHCE